MVQFYETYKDNEIVSPLVAQISWTNNILIFSHESTIEEKEFYIDLVFYNRAYSCLVAFELKIGKFKPEYISKMDLYLEALDRYYKKDNENPSIGVILCTSKDDAKVEFASSRSLSQTLVSTYSTNLIDTKQLEKKLREYRELLSDE